MSSLTTSSILLYAFVPGISYTSNEQMFAFPWMLCLFTTLCICLCCFPFCHSCTSKLLLFHGWGVTSGTFYMWVEFPHVVFAPSPLTYSLLWSIVFVHMWSVFCTGIIYHLFLFPLCLNYCLSVGSNQHIFVQ